MNILIATQSVLSQKLKSFHWEIEGENFLEYHKFFEELYDFFTESTDTLAERIRFFEEVPFRNLKEILLTSVISENTNKLNAKEMINSLLKDINLLLRSYYNSLELIEKLDKITEDLLIGIISDIEKHIWFLKSLNK